MIKGELNGKLKKEIIVNAANAAKIGAAIEAAEGRATVRTITAEDITRKLEEVESYIGITKKALDGVEVKIDCNAQNFPNAYKYAPLSTWFNAVYRGGKWRVTHIYRDYTAAPTRAAFITLTDDAKSAILEKKSYMPL